MTARVKWWLLLAACALAAALLVPLALVIVGLTKLTHRGYDRAELELLALQVRERRAR
jgi:fumarate reductase subunit D